MNLTTSYLGLTLKNPLIVGASPFCDNPTACRALEAAGVSALVMHSLFEEQVDAEARALVRHLEQGSESYAEATSYFPDYNEYHLGTQQYLKRLKRLTELLSIPVIASLNGLHLDSWVGFAQQMEDAGAAAIELNLYQLAADPAIAGDEIEANMLEIVRTVTASVDLPVAVKLSPFHTALPHFVIELLGQGASGVVLFNRFYQPDFDIKELETKPTLKLSDSSELLLRLRWLAMLSPDFTGSLSCSGGVHTVDDFVKALLAGAHSVQVVSALLKHGPEHARVLLDGLKAWMVEMEYTDIDQVRGALNLGRCPDPAAHERANYIRILQSWRV
jgi:dihydroorotate dehydrogenase (fumarate)